MSYSAADAQRVLTLNDLDNWQFGGTALAVLGDPIAHSLSPVMHNAALAAMAQTQQKFANWRYFKFHVRPDDLPEALERLYAAGFCGLNLTVPHKVEVLKILGHAGLSAFASSAGAANTLIRQELKDGDNGRYTLSAAWRGENTDGYGLGQALLKQLNFPLTGSTVILLGAGGAARAAAAYCLMAGVKQLWIANRNAERLDSMIADLRTIVTLPGQRIQGFSPQALPADLPRENLAIVNATSLGLKADDPAPIDLAPFCTASTVVYDMTYGVDNALARDAREREIRFADGLSMLVWQGARALELWSGSSVPAHIMQQALLEHRSRQH